jgi:GTPase SAR1 family protein
MASHQDTPALPAAGEDDAALTNGHTPLSPEITGPRLRVQMVGSPGVGKTSFLGALGLLAQSPRGGMTITAADGETRRRLDDLRQSFKQGQWPPKTFHGQSFEFQLHRGRQTVTVQIDDIAGEAFETAMNRGEQDEPTRRTANLIRQTDLLLLMIDGGRLDGDNPMPQLELTQAIEDKRLAASGRPTRVAVVITKADLCTRRPVRTPAQAKKRVTQRLPELADTIKHRVDQIEWIPVSVCGFGGGKAGKQIAGADPQPTFSPSGFEPLLDLMLAIADEQRSPKWRILLGVVIAAIFLGFAGVRYRDYEADVERRRIENAAIRIQDLPPSVAKVNEPALRARILDVIRQAGKDLDSATTHREIDAILRRIDDLPAAAESLVVDELAELDKKGQQRSESLLFDRVTDAAASGDAESISEAVDQYLKRHPSDPRAEQVRSLLSKQEDKRRTAARNDIKALVVRDAATLERKLELIRKYLDQFESVVSPVEGEQIRVAIEATRGMLEPKTYDVTLVRTAGLDRPRAHGVVVAVDSGEVAKFDDSGTVAEKVWNRKFNVRWQMGSRIELRLLNYRFRNSDIAFFDAGGPLAILVLARKSTPARFGDDFLASRPPVSITMRCDQLDEGTVNAIEQWVYPGDAW